MVLGWVLMNLLEASSFTEDECWDLLQIVAAKDGYEVVKSQSEDSISLALSGPQDWTTQHLDPKVAYLSALGWLESQKSDRVEGKCRSCL